MPNWKKMAEAFGRAVRTPDPESRETARNIHQALADKSFHDMEFAKGQTRAAVDADELNSKAAYFENKYGGNKIPRSAFRDALEEELTDKRLADDFEDAFNSAVERHGYDTWKKGSGDKPLNDGLNGEIHNLEREGAEDDIRAQMIEELKSGVDLSDFFEKYR